MVDQPPTLILGDVPPPADGDLELGYQVEVDAFSGPLDLLLYLVRRTQVDIADIPVALIADQFIATVGSWADLDLDVAGDFILMAATLLEIKSRLVAPPPEGTQNPDGEEADEDFFDPRAGLIRQLLAYRRFKDASSLIAALEDAHAARCPRQLREVIPEDPEEAEGIPLDNADPYALFRAWEVVIAKIAGAGPRTVIYDDVPMEERMATLVATMQATGEARLSWLFESLHSRPARVGMLVALLECSRQRIVEVLQHEQYGEVYLRFRPEAERVMAAAPPPALVEEGDAKRRRRRQPLVTWQSPQGEAPGEDDEADPLEEEVVETDDQRFTRELNEACAVDEVLARVVDIEAGFAAFRAERAAEREQPAAPADAAAPASEG